MLAKRVDTHQGNLHTIPRLGLFASSLRSFHTFAYWWLHVDLATEDRHAEST